MITPIRGRKLSSPDASVGVSRIRNDNPDKGTETGVVDYILKVGYKKIRNDNPDKGTETSHKEMTKVS